VDTRGHGYGVVGSLIGKHSRSHMQARHRGRGRDSGRLADGVWGGVGVVSRAAAERNNDREFRGGQSCGAIATRLTLDKEFSLFSLYCYT